MKNFLRLGELRGTIFDELSLFQIFVGFGIALVLTSILVGYQFQLIPTYNIGDISDRTVEAPHDFTVEDREATSHKKEEIIRGVPVVFNLDLRENARVEAELRKGFQTGRTLLKELRSELELPADAPIPEAARARLISQLRSELPRFDKDQVLQILLRDGFSVELEVQLVDMLRQNLKEPGVILNRDYLLSYQSRGIILRNTITGEENTLDYWMTVKDLDQAREELRQKTDELTVVSRAERAPLIEFLASWIVPNIRYSAEDTQYLENLATRDTDPVLIQVKKGKTIVRAGDEINAKQLMQLEALKKLKQPRRLVGKFAGILAIVCFFSFILWHYLVAHHSSGVQKYRHYVLLSLILVCSLAVTKVFLLLADLVAENLAQESLQNPLHFYLIAPLALGGFLTILLMDVQLSILYSLIFAVLIALLTGEISTAVFALAGNLTAVYVLNQYRERAAIIKAGLLIGLINILIAVALQLYVSSLGFQWSIFFIRTVSACLSGLFAAMLASLLLPILESMFEITTDIKLLELSNLNKPILKRLAVEAPGTYHHSIMVGTLAESAAEAVGANPLLVRVGAYYHDIGKLTKPEYYVENQIYCGNKHEGLSPSMSSLILASHVKDGLTMAEEIKLVPQVRDLIPQHHGTRLMTYFFQKAKDLADDKNGQVNEDDFRYPGPKPQTKEAAILMLADQVEAASRTLQEPTTGQIRSLIRRLVQSTIQDGQLDECDITMKELDRAARAFERVIAGMYHHRIEYPGFDFNKTIEDKRSETQRIQ